MGMGLDQGLRARDHKKHEETAAIIFDALTFL
jgi:hypothetical protein